MEGRFEWHITINKEYRKDVIEISEELNLVFSEITGCPILGQGTYCYLTGYDTNDLTALYNIKLTEKKLMDRNIPILRSKMENIWFDTKTNVNRIQ
jgi:hypothetical protein